MLFQISNSIEEVLVVVNDMLGKKIYPKTIDSRGNGKYTIRTPKKLNPRTYLITSDLHNKFYQKRLQVRYIMSNYKILCQQTAGNSKKR